MVFNKRVKTTFPIGTNEGKVVSSLLRDGFKTQPAMSDGIRIASLTRGGLVCRKIWSVRWKSASGKVVDIFGVYGLQCM